MSAAERATVIQLLKLTVASDLQTRERTMTSPASACEHIDIEQREQILYLRFNRPERKNALSRAMYSALADAIVSGNQDSEIRVLVLSGQGADFTSGNDLLDFMDEPQIAEQHPAVRFMRALQGADKPVIASVRGAAIGIGTTMLLHCDLIYAADSARLQLPFVNLGLCPEYAASYLLPRLVGTARANELLLLGEALTAQQALAYGMINAVVAEDRLDSFVAERAQHLVKQPPAAVRRTKALLKRALQAPIEMALTAELAALAEGLQSAECKEAVSAFFDKRTPDFSRFS
jgi:enoyl-CoA hydratase/carnithine racemase